MHFPFISFEFFKKSLGVENETKPLELVVILSQIALPLLTMVGYSDNALNSDLAWQLAQQPFLNILQVR